ncbi:MAG: chorismate synthase [Bacteroidales bacterium]|nr:chorismate synthase [Bacteroidales bacterium]
MNTFGNRFRVSIFGESHGPVVGITLDGVPAGLPLSEEDFKADILRRKPGATGTTPRTEEDVPEFLSGVYEGHTTGAPLTIVFRNENSRSADYSGFRKNPRPGHADYVADVKFSGFNDPRGGGHFSGRLTVGIVAAGVIAKKMLPEITIAAQLTEVGGLDNPSFWQDAVKAAAEDGDSLGGIVQCRAQGIPAGLGEPFWDSVESLISHAVFSIPGVRGIEFGDGFETARIKGSENAHRGGVAGGITNGEELEFRVAFKPTASIAKAGIPGRHDACFALRTPVIVEAMTAIVLANLRP